MDQYGSEQYQQLLRLATELDLDGQQIQQLRNIVEYGALDREGELSVQDSAAGDFAGMEAVLDGNQLAISGGRAHTSAHGELQLAGYQFGGGVPDSGLLHFPFGERTDSTLVEELEGADGTANGLTNVSGDWKENYAEDGDGADDYGDLGDWSEVSYPSRLTSDWGLALTFQTTDDGIIPFGTQEDTANQTFRLDLGIGDVPSGEIGLFIRDAFSSNGQTIGTGQTVNDGNKHRLLVGGDGPAASDKVCYLDGSDVTTVYADNGDHNSFDPFVYNVYSHARNFEGNADQFGDITLDNIILLDSKPTSQVATDDYLAQPWS